MENAKRLIGAIYIPLKVNAPAQSEATPDEPAAKLLNLVLRKNQVLLHLNLRVVQFVSRWCDRHSGVS